VVPIFYEYGWDIRCFDELLKDIILMIVLFGISFVEGIIQAVRKSPMGDIMQKSGNLFFQSSSIESQQEKYSDRMFVARMTSAGNIRLEVSCLIYALKSLHRLTSNQLLDDRFRDVKGSIDGIIDDHGDGLEFKKSKMLKVQKRPSPPCLLCLLLMFYDWWHPQPTTLYCATNLEFSDLPSSKYFLE